ncbi:MAG: hypothetical protein ABI821_17090 [Pseudomonadota bacterium]
MMTSRLLLAGLLCAGIAALASAQTPDDKIPVYKLDLRKVPDIPKGDAALVKGDAGSTPDRFFVENLYMLKPVSVTVRAVNSGGVVHVKLTKNKWDEVLREATTGEEGQVNFKFRTQGEFQISITSPNANTPYKMVVWVGPDIVPKTRPVFVPESQFKGGGKSHWWWWAGGGAAIIVFILLALAFRKRKQAS